MVPSNGCPELIDEDDAMPPTGPLYQVEVDHYPTMKTQRVYPLRVRFPKAPSFGNVTDHPMEGNITVRPIVPGAIVTPSEQSVPLTSIGEQLVFYITPLAYGALPEARLEYSVPTQPVQQLPLNLRGVSQRSTVRSLLLLFIVPMIFFMMRGATSWASSEEAGGYGMRDRLEMLIPGFMPMKQPTIQVAQGVTDLLVLQGGAMVMSFVTAMFFLVLTIVGWNWNRVSKRVEKGAGFSLHHVDTSTPKVKRLTA